MQLPFSVDQFLDVFRAYNQGIGIAPLLLLLLAIAAVVVAHTRAPWRHRAIVGVLAGLWAWSGIVYHWGFFTTINGGAWIFGAAFIAQACVLAAIGIARDGLRFAPPHRDSTIVGWVLVVYALVVYPLLGVVFGHAYPAAPTFGAPCPMVIFFFGMMLWTAGPIRWATLIVPLAWALLGTSAAVQLGMREDLGLVIAAIVTLGEAIRRRGVHATTPAYSAAR